MRPPPFVGFLVFSMKPKRAADSEKAQDAFFRRSRLIDNLCKHLIGVPKIGAPIFVERSVDSFREGSIDPKTLKALDPLPLVQSTKIHVDSRESRYEFREKERRREEKESNLIRATLDRPKSSSMCSYASIVVLKLL